MNSDIFLTSSAYFANSGIVKLKLSIMLEIDPSYLFLSCCLIIYNNKFCATFSFLFLYTEIILDIRVGASNKEYSIENLLILQIHHQ